VTPTDEVKQRYKAVLDALDYVDAMDVTQRQREQMLILLSYIRGDIRLLLRAHGLKPEDL
jgi:hypothetical protein